ncbi:hypothetical protein NN561_012787 [Cricetulus griseus]
MHRGPDYISQHAKRPGLSAGLHSPACKALGSPGQTTFPGMLSADSKSVAREAWGLGAVGSTVPLLRPFSSSSVSGTRRCRPGSSQERQGFPARHLSPVSTGAQTVPRMGRAGWRPSKPDLL